MRRRAARARAVSYTHLEVYKRKAHRGEVRAGQESLIHRHREIDAVPARHVAGQEQMLVDGRQVGPAALGLDCGHDGAFSLSLAAGAALPEKRQATLTRIKVQPSGCCANRAHGLTVDLPAPGVRRVGSMAVVSGVGQPVDSLRAAPRVKARLPRQDRAHLVGITLHVLGICPFYTSRCV